MGRQWFASLVRGRGVAAKLALLILLFSVAPAVADPGTKGTPSPGLDQNFLLLPAYDLDWVSPPHLVKVGDTLIAKLDSSGKLSVKDAQALSIKVPPGIEDPSSLGFDVSDKISQAGDLLEISFTVLKAGQVSVPSLALVDSSDKAVARTNPISFEAQSSIPKDDPKPKEVEPPKPPVSLGLPLATLIGLGLLLLALIAGGIYWLVRWSRARRANIPAVIVPPKPEDEVALAAFAQLEKKGLIRAGQFKVHYFAISEIIKHYFGARFDFDAAESTTYEMISYLEQNQALGDSVMSPLREMFDRLDRVKFTDYVPVAVEGTELLEDAKRLVMITRRPPPIIVPEGKVASRASG